MALRLPSHVLRHDIERAWRDGPQVVPVGPPQPHSRHNTVSIGHSGTGALECLHEPWDVTAMATHVRLLAEDSARVLVHEVLDWRIVFLDRPLEVGA